MPPEDQDPLRDTPPAKAPAGGSSRQFSLAFELPFVLVGTILVGGLLGVFLDRWMGSKPLMTFVLGAMGFAAGVREVLRRMRPSGTDGNARKER